MADATRRSPVTRHTVPKSPKRTAPMRRSPTTKVADIMTSTVVTATAEETLPQLVDLMLHYGISGIPIVDDESHLGGMVTEADLISKPAYGGTRRRPLAVLGDILRGSANRWEKKSRGLTASDIMTKVVETASPNEDVRVAARRMVEGGVKRLPVVDDSRVVGIISRADVLRRMHRSDADLQGDITAVLSDPMRVPETTDIEATVYDGIVTLRGTVRYPIDVPVLSSIVWRFPGVVDVHNEATPTEPNPEPWQPTHSEYGYDHLRYFR